METTAGDILMPTIESDLRTIMGRWERLNEDAKEVSDEKLAKIFATR